MPKSIDIVAVEAVVVGALLVVFIYIAAYLLHVIKYPMVATPAECKKWNDTYIMEATTFVAGFLFHIAFEYMGINEQYAKNYKKEL